MKRLTLLVVGILLLVGGCRYSMGHRERASGEAAQPLREVRYVMGTLLDLVVYVPPDVDGRAVLNEAFGIAERLDSQLSTYKLESDVTLFNTHLEAGARETSPVLVELVKRSQELSELTDGAFDITVRPLVDLWNIASKRGVAPTPDELVAVSRVVNYRELLVVGSSTLSRRVKGVQVETGGIGKGFAVDKIVSLLRERRVIAAFVNFGRSSMAAIGAPPGAVGWQVELDLEEGVNEGMLFLRDETLSVSRARGNPFVVDGISYAHIFDPRTKRPVRAVRGAAVRTREATAGEAYVKFLVIRGAPSNTIEQRWLNTGWIVKTKEEGVRSSPNFWGSHQEQTISD